LPGSSRTARAVASQFTAQARLWVTGSANDAAVTAWFVMSCHVRMTSGDAAARALAASVASAAAGSAARNARLDGWSELGRGCGIAGIPSVSQIEPFGIASIFH
jgi:hypothetical protein